MKLVSSIDLPQDIARRFDVSRESLEKLQAYVQLLLRWQAKINLVGRSTRDDIWCRHIADALQLLDHIPKKAKSILDLGSGAGLPGLVLAIGLEGRGNRVQVNLVESNGKKAAFLREAIRLTQAPAIVRHCRIEDLEPKSFPVPVDVVSARALAPLSDLLLMAEPYVKQGAMCVFLKGQDVDFELTETTKCWNTRVEKVRSQTDSGGRVLKIWEISGV